MADLPLDSAGEPAVVSPSDLLRWAEALAGVARTGLGFTENLYERERFEEVLKIAADIRYHALEEVEAGVQIEEWISSVGKGVPGYVTPKTAVGAVVGNEAARSFTVLESTALKGAFPPPGETTRSAFQPTDRPSLTAKLFSGSSMFCT